MISEMHGHTRELPTSYEYSTVTSISQWVLQRDWNESLQACWLSGGHLGNSLVFTECTIAKQCKAQLPFMSRFFVYGLKMSFLIRLNSNI